MIFSSSYICTDTNGWALTYTDAYKYWNLGFAIFYLLSSSQGIVDLLWIFVYNASYLSKKKEVDLKKARSEVEFEIIQKENDKRVRRYHIFFAFLLVFDMILGILYVIGAYQTKDYSEQKDKTDGRYEDLLIYVLLGMVFYCIV